MRILGRVTPADQAAFQRLGLSPAQAIDAIFAEARRRYPDIGINQIVPSPTVRDCRDIVGL